MAESIVIYVVTNVISSVISSAIIRSDERNIRAREEINGKVHTLQTTLTTIKNWLQHIENRSQRSSWDADRVRQIEGVAYQAQDVIDLLSWSDQQQHSGERSMTSTIIQKCEYALSLVEIGKQIDTIIGSIPYINELTEALRNISLEEGSCKAGQSDNQRSKNPRETIHTKMDDQVQVIGFGDQINKLREILTGNHERIISIVGMGGIGKSALAMKIFNDSEVQNLFHERIWIGISNQEYNVQINNEGVKKMTGEEVRNMLIKSLEEQKCLIVVDGIWETSSWIEITHDNSIFSNISNGSRIIQTTRKLDVARYPSNVTNRSARIKTYEYEVKLLDIDKEICELLEKKAFRSDTMKCEKRKRTLKSWHSDLTRKCGGLPLALIALGDHISRRLIEEQWSRKPDEIDWDELVEEGINISQSLSLSFDDLPPRLKPIFLYITCFPEDQSIRVSELVKLLIAEQFIRPVDNCSLEKMAQELVEELHKRSLVMVKKRSKAHGWITRIMVHDVLRDWGRARAKKEKFLSVIESIDHVEVAKDFYRVALHGRGVGDLANPMSNLRSLLGFKLPEEEIVSAGLNCPRIIAFNPSGPIKKSPEFIMCMIFLRHICLRKFKEINLPASIEQLYRLQTLDCRESTINSLSDKLWKIPTLRHVYLNFCCNWHGPGRDSVKNLKSVYICDRPSKKSLDRWNPLARLKFLKYTGLNEIAEAVDKMTGIVTLRLISDTGSLPWNILNKISPLPSLEVLELREVYVVNKEKGLSRIPLENRFPKNLKKIKLGCPNLVDDPMPFLGKLPELKVLELINVTLDSMHSSADSFPALEYFTIVNFLGKELKADDGAMPNLCHLKLDGCTNLVRISKEIQEHSNLMLELTNGTCAPFDIRA